MGAAMPDDFLSDDWLEQAYPGLTAAQIRAAQDSGALPEQEDLGLREDAGYTVAPDGSIIPYDYRTGVTAQKEEERSRKAEEQALKDWEREQGRAMFWENIDQDFLSGLDQYLPDYDTLLDRSGTSFQDIMGGASAEQGALQRGADIYNQLYQQGGYSPLERAQIQQAQQQAARAEQSQRAALQQQMQMRGMGGSGMEMMGALQAQQSGANQGLQASTDIATQAQQRALQALQQGTQFGGQAGSAADRFNAANLGWQDWRQSQAMGAQQQNLQNQANYAQMMQGRSDWLASMGRALQGNGEAPDAWNPADYAGIGASLGQGAVQGYNSAQGGGSS